MKINLDKYYDKNINIYFNDNYYKKKYNLNERVKYKKNALTNYNVNLDNNNSNNDICIHYIS